MLSGPKAACCLAPNGAAAMIITPEIRLAAVLVTLDGLTPDELLADTEGRAAALGDAVRNYAAEKLAANPAVAGEAEDPLFTDRRSAGQIAQRLALVADNADLAALGQVARGIGRMEHASDADARHSEAFRLHIEALRLVGVSPGPMTEVETGLVAHLDAMRDKLGISS